MNLEHHYALEIEWTGNRGVGTADYKAYGREHVVRAEGKHDLEGSSDPSFRGDRTRWNPEELLLAALSQCHMLSYLHEAAKHAIVVDEYRDAATGTMLQSGTGGHFTSATLRPRVTVSVGDLELARSLHHEASLGCFIAASVNFPVNHEPEIVRG